jgi:cytochrome c oxidase subunit 3
MGAILVFLAIVGAVAAWWLRPHRLASKPWLDEGSSGAAATLGGPPVPAQKIGLVVFLAVAGSLFCLSISAYFMRMHMADWRMLPDPPILWLNTVLLVASSIALEAGHRAAVARRNAAARIGILVAGGTAAAFLAGQIIACRDLVAAGYYATSNPAASFFYLLTGLHGAHLVGGLVALVRAAAQSADPRRFRMRVGLCAIYWHFLLIVWLVLFALLKAT